MLSVAGPVSRLAAQGFGTVPGETETTVLHPVATPTGPITLPVAPITGPGNVITFNGSPLRTYSGPATQVTAAGAATSGTFTFSYFKGGQLSATTVFNGVTTSYYGLLPHIKSNGISGERAGFLLTSIPTTTTSGGAVFTTYSTTIIPVVVDKTVVSGGIQNADGTSLTFRGERQPE